MSTVEDNNLTVLRGDTFSKKLTFTTDATPAVALNLTGAYITFTVKNSLSDADVDAVISLTTASGITEDSYIQGQVIATITASTLAALATKTYRYDIQAILASGEVVTPRYGTGTFRVIGDVSRLTSAP